MLGGLFSFLSEDIGIDLGTANTLAYVRGRGIVINEPSIVAINQRTKQILAVGQEAQAMVGKTPAHIVAHRPLVDGVVSDFEVTEQMLRYFISRVHREKFSIVSRPRVIIGIPHGVTEVERRAVEEAAISAGARQAFLIEEPVASAIGSRLPIQEPTASMIVDIGGGTTEVAVISMGGIVTSRSIRTAGDELNQDIIDFARDHFNLVLGERTAEKLKIEIGSAYPIKDPQQHPMRGRDLVSGLPHEVIVTDEQIRLALTKSVALIVAAVRETLEETPPELVADIMERGIVLAGGGALLQGLDRLVSQQTQTKVFVADDPLTCVARGIGVVLEDLETLESVLLGSALK